MKPPYYIEILARNGEVQHRHAFSDLPISIGRAYDNALILDDVHTAAHHALLESDGADGLTIRDLGSLNGLMYRGRRRAALSLDGHSVVRLGQTNLRVRGSDFAVEKEAFDSSNYGWEGWPPALTGLILISLLSLSGSWLSDVEKFAPIRYLMTLAQILVTGLFWSGVWAFANRLFGAHARFGRHLFIAACGMTAAQLLSYLSALAGYAFSWEILTRYSSHLFVAIAAATLYFHLLTIKPRLQRRLQISALLFCLTGSALVLMTNYQRNGRLTDEFYMNDLFAPSLRVSPNHSVAHFISEAQKLQEKVDAGRSEVVSRNEAEGEVD